MTSSITSPIVRSLSSRPVNALDDEMYSAFGVSRQQVRELRERAAGLLDERGWNPWGPDEDLLRLGPDHTRGGLNMDTALSAATKDLELDDDARYVATQELRVTMGMFAHDTYGPLFWGLEDGRTLQEVQECLRGGLRGVARLAVEHGVRMVAVRKLRLRAAERIEDTGWMPYPNLSRMAELLPDPHGPNTLHTALILARDDLGFQDEVRYVAHKAIKSELRFALDDPMRLISWEADPRRSQADVISCLHGTSSRKSAAQ